MRRAHWITGCLIAGCVLALAPRGVCGGDKAGKTSEAAVAPAPAGSLEGTTWEGVDSDGDFYRITFLAAGHLRYTTNTGGGEMRTYEQPGNYWAQNGPVVVITIRDYVTRVGHIDGARMSGDAWNVAGRRWTWKLERK